MTKIINRRKVLRSQISDPNMYATSSYVHKFPTLLIGVGEAE